MGLTLGCNKRKVSNPLSTIAVICLLFQLVPSLPAFAAGRSAPRGRPQASRLWISAIQDHHPVRNLKREDLRLWIGKKQETISKLTFLPPGRFVLGLLVDVSGSQREGWPSPSLALAPAFLRRILGPGDSAFLAEFSDHARLITRPTADRALLTQGLGAIAAETPRGGTALYDAIIASCNFLSRTSAGTHNALLLVTDGEDDSSLQTLQKTIHVARATHTAIYVLDTNPQNLRGGLFAEPEIRKAMSEATGATGGLLLPARKKPEMARALDTVVLALQARYSLDFQLTQTVKRDRQIRIVCLRPNVQIVAPELYY